MFGFNVNAPTSLEAIDQYIGSYATPEAAESDTLLHAPRGYDYLEKQYQDVTGDAFAHPFEDAKNARARSMTEAAMNGASVATGSNTGMRLLSLPTPGAPLPVQADPMVANANAKHTVPTVGPTLPSGSLPLSPLGTKELARASLLKMMQTQGNQYRMASSDMQIPAPTDGNYMDVLSKRAALTGTADAFEKIRQNNPTALQTQTGGDPRFARLQGKDGKAIGATIHPLAFDDTFQELARQQPEKAQALYHAVTNRDYATDHDAQVQLITEQRDARKKIIEGIKGLEADPITGKMFKIVETKDFDGSIKQQRVPITPLDEAAIAAEGGAKRIYGVDLPGMGGLKKIPGMTDKGHSEYQNRAAALRSKNPDLTVEQASAQALASMKLDQAKSKAAGVPQGEGVGLLDTLLQFNPKDAIAAGAVNPVVSMMRSTNKVFNTPARAANALAALFGSNWRAQPMWDENMPFMDTSVSGDETKRRAAAAEYLRQRMGMAGAAYAGQ
jgi:hypothetical protein